MKKKTIVLIYISFFLVTIILPSVYQLFASSKYKNMYSYFKKYKNHKDTHTPTATNSSNPTKTPTETAIESTTENPIETDAVTAEDGKLDHNAKLYNLAWSNSDNHEKTSINNKGNASTIILLDCDVDENTISKYKNQGYQVAGYISVGSWEDWRNDKSNFPSNVFGESYDGWAGETWFKVSEWENLIPGMTKRMNKLKNKGFQLVEFDNIAFETGSKSEIKNYALELAKIAKSNSLLPLFKNGAELIDDDIEEAYSGFIVEEAFEYNETSIYKINDKPVWFFEYDNINESKIEDWMNNVWLDTKSGWQKIK